MTSNHASLRSSPVRDALLTGVCQAAQALARGTAASISLLDRGAHELVFAAATGDAAIDLPGARYRADAGVAGRVVASATAEHVTDLSGEPSFARDVATATGYQPDGLTAVPLRQAGTVIGVLTVLDPAAPDGHMDGLARLAEHAVEALVLADAL